MPIDEVRDCSMGLEEAARRRRSVVLSVRIAPECQQRDGVSHLSIRAKLLG